MLSRDPKAPTLSLIIPVYNEEEGMPALVERLNVLLQKIGVPTEVIFVDDHSGDGSPELLKQACITRPELRYVRLARNRGSHIAILAGLAHAHGECAVFLAADLQDPPELIPRMMEQWRMGFRVVWAVREKREGISPIDRFMSNSFYRLLNRLADVELPPSGSDFALLDRKVIDALLLSAGSNPSLGGEIATLGFSHAEVMYTKQRRRYGRSKWSLERKLKAFADAFVSFSYAPLRAMSYLGMLCSLLGFLYAATIIILRLISRIGLTGWSSLMVVVLLLSGVQMVMLGILGEYLWRTLDAARRRPNYFIEELSGFESGACVDAPATTTLRTRI
jgi:polyisoprenyl-phosphate glycosyltransferase